MSNQHTISLAAGPELNVSGPLSHALVAAVNAACDRAEDGAAGTALLFRLHAGFAPDSADTVDVALVNLWERALRRVERLGVPTVACVDGPCGGLGLALLLATDYRIVTPALHLSLALGGEEILPGMVLHRLASQIGAARARRLALFGAVVDAGTACAYGLADQVSDEPSAAAAAFIATLDGSTLANLPVRRRLVLEASASSYEDSLGTHLAACDRTLRAAARASAPQAVAA
jgi:isomerase DpgB